MRIWDISPGYLNRQSLLGEHRELHGLVSILTNNKKGYSRHPETVRWVGYGWALKQRHHQLACEMKLRGFADKTPVKTRTNKGAWPTIYIDAPHIQFKLLQEKYADKEKGRIPLPQNEQQLWSHHKYSVLARDHIQYREIGRRIAARQLDFPKLAKHLTEILRTPPTPGGIRNAFQHMWGHVSYIEERKGADISAWSLRKLINKTQKNAMQINEPYITSSTALSELAVWL